MEMIAGTIGRIAAEKLVNYMRFENETVHVKDIKGVAHTAPISNNVPALFMTLHHFVQELETQDDLSDCVTYLKRAKQDEMMHLFYTLVHRNARTAAISFLNKDVKEFGRKNSEILAGL